MNYQSAEEIDLSREQVFSFFSDLEKWFRLNPQWNVLAFEGDSTPRPGSTFTLKIEYDRAEKEVEYRGTIEELTPPETLTVNLEGEYPRRMTIEVRDARYVTLLKYREPQEQALSDHEQRELNLWLKSVANYIQVAHRKSPFSKLWKWFLDRYWLRMSPSGRRTVFFVIAAEGLSLAFFFLILLWILVFKKL
ncbi:MAG: SRPBCC domain-containing protein [Acidobacteriota bacterium]